MLELYHWEPNTLSLKPLIVLHEKGLAFTSRYVDFLSLDDQTLPAEIASAMEVRHNPEGDGPILVDRGTAMTESFFIGLYLEDAYPRKPLRAADAANRWRMLMWARFVNEMLEPAVSTLGAKKYLVPALLKRDRRAVEKAIAQMLTKEKRDGWSAALDDSYTEELLADSSRKLSLGINKVEEALAHGAWLAGPDYSLADIDAYALIAPARDLGPDLLADAPRTREWLARIDARPAVKAALGASRTGKPHEAYAPGPEHSRWG